MLAIFSAVLGGAFFDFGCRTECSPDRYCHTRFCRYVSKHYTLPRPTVQPKDGCNPTTVATQRYEFQPGFGIRKGWVVQVRDLVLRAPTPPTKMNQNDAFLYVFFGGPTLKLADFNWASWRSGWRAFRPLSQSNKSTSSYPALHRWKVLPTPTSGRAPRRQTEFPWNPSFSKVFCCLFDFLGLDDFAQSKFAFWGFATVLKGRATATLEHDPLFLTKCSASVADFECAL